MNMQQQQLAKHNDTAANPNTAVLPPACNQSTPQPSNRTWMMTLASGMSMEVSPTLERPMQFTRGFTLKVPRMRERSLSGVAP